MQKQYANGIVYISGDGFQLSPSRVKEMVEILGINEDFDLSSDDKYYIVLAWPELFDSSMCHAAIIAVIHSLPMRTDLPYWESDQGRLVIEKFELHDKTVVSKIFSAWCGSMSGESKKRKAG